MPACKLSPAAAVPVAFEEKVKAPFVMVRVATQVEAAAPKKILENNS
jgi:hypothetical protein